MTALIMAAASRGTINLTYALADIPGEVEHMHYYGYDASGKLVYESPDMNKSALHTLSWMPRGVVLLNAVLHTDSHVELSVNSYNIDFTGNAFLNITSHQCGLNTARVALVDENTANGNLLVRGNLPMKADCTTFDYKDLNDKMGTIITGFNLDEYEILDISLINNQGDKTNLIDEIGAFGLSSITCEDGWPPSNGCAWDPTYIYVTTLTSGQNPRGFVWWPVYTCDALPCSESIGNTSMNDFQFKDLPKFMSDRLSETPSSGKKRLIYFHCMHGADRTGAVNIAYLMYMNTNLTLIDAICQSSYGCQRGHTEKKDRRFDPVVIPPDTDIAVAQRYCLEIYPGNTTKCGYSIPNCN